MLRSQVSLLDQVHQVEETLAGVRVDAQPDRAQAESGDLFNGRRR